MSDPHSGARIRPIIRVFVSSTFADFKAERDALQQRVFPELENYCQKDGFQFQAIDLRWGVSREAGLDHRTMRICFEELRRSQELSPEPNFLILLGDRYGWRPLPEEISADEFRSLFQAAAQIDSLGQTHESEEVLLRWYRLDNNALTPTYFLQPRAKPDPEDPRSDDYTAADTWRTVQDALWQIINIAFPAGGLRDRFVTPVSSHFTLPSIVRFQSSATEQEIWCGALNVANASQHVVALLRRIGPTPHIADPAQIQDFFDFDVVKGAMDCDLHAAQYDLKAEIKKRLDGNAVELPLVEMILEKDESGKLIAVVSTAHIEQLCHEVTTRLTDIIDRQIKEYWRETTAPDRRRSPPSTDRRSARELEIEQDEHSRFARERGPKEIFVGREEQCRIIRDYLENDSCWPLVVYGASGIGKTALMARVAQDVPAETTLIVRFIGVTPRSSDLLSLLSSVCQELRTRNLIAGSMPTDVQELMQELRSQLRMATSQQPVILLLDALDQLSDADNGRELFWIPFDPLPSNVKIIVSCLSDRPDNDPAGQPFVALQSRRLPPENMVNLDVLSRDEAITLLYKRWLPAAGRTLKDDSQRRLIEDRLRSPVCRQPLYLKLLFEEIKRWKSYDKVATPGEDVPALVQQLCARLSEPHNHGKVLVERALGYIAAARRGLSEIEILEVLFADDPGYKSLLDLTSQRYHHKIPNDPPRIPIAIWSRLRYDLAPYLTERAAPGGNVLTFYHRHLADLIHNTFVAQSSWKPHERLSDFFDRKASILHTEGISSEEMSKPDRLHTLANHRKMDELPWHLMRAGRFASLHSTLVDIPLFLSAMETHEFDWMGYWHELPTHFKPGPSYNQMVQSAASRGWDSRGIACLRFSVATLLHTMGLSSDAIPFAEEAIVFETRDEQDDSATMTIRLNLLSSMYAEIGDYTRSLHYGNRALDYAPRTGVRRFVAQCYGTLAFAYHKLGLDAEQTPIAATSTTRVSLGHPYYHRAADLYKEALVITANDDGDESPLALSCLRGLGAVLSDMRDYAAAEPILRESVATLGRLKGRCHPETAEAMATLALFLSDRGDLSESRRLHLFAIDIFENILGPNHPSTIIALNNLALMFQISASRGMSGGYRESTSLWWLAIRRARQHLGKQHPYYHIIRKHLGSNVRDMLVRLGTALGMQILAVGLVGWSTWLWFVSAPLVLVGVFIQVLEFKQWCRPSPLKGK